MSSVPCFNSCKLVPPHSSQILAYANSFEKLLQDFCPLCIILICIHFFYQCTILKCPHLPFGCQNPNSWQISLSRVFLNTIWQNITMNNYFSKFALFCFALYNFHNSTLLVSSSDINVSNLILWKIFENDFNPMA